MKKEFKLFPENFPSSEQHSVIVKIKDGSPLHNMLDGSNEYTVKTWDRKFFIPDPFTGLCSKHEDTEYGFDITDQVTMFAEI